MRAGSIRSRSRSRSRSGSVAIHPDVLGELRKSSSAIRARRGNILMQAAPHLGRIKNKIIIVNI